MSHRPSIFVHSSIKRGAEIVGGTPEEFAAYLKSEIDKWGKVARSTNSKLVY